jgi:hypothetical protein
MACQHDASLAAAIEGMKAVALASQATAEGLKLAIEIMSAHAGRTIGHTPHSVHPDLTNAIVNGGTVVVQSGERIVQVGA